MNYLYTLQLEQGKYYVGITDNPNFILEDHTPTEWTNKYKPIEVIEFEESVDEYLFTVFRINSYGINNVRGFLFERMELNPSEIKHLLEESCSQIYHHPSKNLILEDIESVDDDADDDVCNICGMDGHYEEGCHLSNDPNLRSWR